MDEVQDYVARNLAKNETVRRRFSTMSGLKAFKKKKKQKKMMVDMGANILLNYKGLLKGISGFLQLGSSDKNKQTQE